MNPGDNKGAAFVKGGAGCLLLFVVVALVVVLVGGSAHLDLGGAAILFVIGGLLALLANWIYQKGRRDASGDDD